MAILLIFKADTHLQNNSQDSPWHLGARSGDLKIVQLLVDSGAAVNSCGGDGDVTFLSTQQ